MITQHFGTFGGITLHYREINRGAGTPVILLHPSPKSSAMYEPLMGMFSRDQHVIALDTPGYGYSAPLPTPAASIADYLPTLKAFFHAVAGARFKLYGSATGAQLALGYANAYPDDVAHLLLDNAAHFDDTEREAIVARYFPDLTPREDGGHLLTAWRMVAQMAEFFPWFMADEAHRISARRPTPDEVHAGVRELLAAGPGWALAYRCAFEHERASHVMALTVPTTVCRWAASVLLPHIDRLLAHPLPSNVQVLQVPAALPQRFAIMTAHLAALRAGPAP